MKYYYARHKQSKFQKRSLKMLELVSKHNITKNIQNNNPLKLRKKKTNI